jgi:predicted metal-dependent hydrolase
VKLPRYVPDASFPPYSYVTGHFAHPTGDPAGHSYGHDHVAPPALDLDTWHENRDYLFGIDLFNHGYYWEAHEVWEGLWHACGRRGTSSDFLKVLIKLAAAGVKARERRPAGVRRHALRAAELFRQTADTQSGPQRAFMGLAMDDLASSCEQLADQPPAAQNEPPAAVERLIPFRLLPA